jgi:hypothetical protein
MLPDEYGKGVLWDEPASKEDAGRVMVDARDSRTWMLLAIRSGDDRASA